MYPDAPQPVASVVGRLSNDSFLRGGGRTRSTPHALLAIAFMHVPKCCAAAPLTRRILCFSQVASPIYRLIRTTATWMFCPGRCMVGDSSLLGSIRAHCIRARFTALSLPEGLRRPTYEARYVTTPPRGRNTQTRTWSAWRLGSGRQVRKTSGIETRE